MGEGLYILRLHYTSFEAGVAVILSLVAFGHAIQCSDQGPLHVILCMPNSWGIWLFPPNKNCSWENSKVRNYLPFKGLIMLSTLWYIMWNFKSQEISLFLQNSELLIILKIWSILPYHACMFLCVCVLCVFAWLQEQEGGPLCFILVKLFKVYSINMSVSVFVTLNFCFSVLFIYLFFTLLVCVSLGIMEEWSSPLFSHSLKLHHRIERTEEMERNSKIIWWKGEMKESGWGKYNIPYITSLKPLYVPEKKKKKKN